jgi:ABC-type branched-subunit amino acid transport system ATPase component/ABC-type branched-subunit amino acid transport system permease subunit
MSRTASSARSSTSASRGLAVLPRWSRFLLAAALAAALPLLVGATTGVGAAWFLVGSQGVVYAMAALSLNQLMGYAGQISLGHTGFMAVGAYAAGLVVSKADGGFVLGLMVAGLVGALFAFVIGLPALRLRGLLLAVVTLAFLTATLESLLRLDIVKSGSVGTQLPRPSFGSISLASEPAYLAFVLVLLVGFLALDSNLTSSRLGRSFLGIREDEQVAQSYGIDVARTKLTAFVLSGASAGVAGAAFGHIYLSAQPVDFRLDLSLAMVAWVVIGGLGSRVGVTVSALLFGIFPYAFDQMFGSVLEDLALVVGALLFLYTVATNPNGFVGNIKEKRDAKAAKAARAALATGQTEGEDEILPSLPVPAARHGDVEPGSLMLDVRDVIVRFGGLTAVDAASIEVRAGEIVGLIGPNGAGKTTLFDAIGGFNQPDGGTVELRGRALQGMPPHERANVGLGRTFQRLGLAMSLSVRENLLLAQHALVEYDTLQALGHSPRVARAEEMLEQRAAEVIEALGFERYADLPVKYLSGGQRRIVEIACTLVTAPDLLMLDEPTAGMAPAAVENLADRLRELRDVHGRTILLIEHHVPLVLDVCDRIYVLDHGMVIAEGSPDEILRHPHVLAAYLGERAAEQAGLVDEVVADVAVAEVKTSIAETDIELMIDDEDRAAEVLR